MSLDNFFWYIMFGIWFLWVLLSHSSYVLIYFIFLGVGCLGSGWTSCDRNDFLCWFDRRANSCSYGRKTSLQTGTIGDILLFDYLESSSYWSFSYRRILCSEDILLNAVSMQKMLLRDLDQGQVSWFNSVYLCEHVLKDATKNTF